MRGYDVLIAGGGAAGLAAAGALHKAGRSFLLVERDAAPGGILLQCAHDGFGDGLDGPAYARELLSALPDGLPIRTGVTVTKVTPDRTAALSDGETVHFGALILATGCREVPIGALPIAGTRPRGVYTAGQMQERMNRHGYIPKGPAAILGSGDIGLVMAWQLARIGVPVTVLEQQDRCTGLKRNRMRIPKNGVTWRFGVTVERLCGYPELSGLVLSDGSALPCRLLLTAVGLRPERELLDGLGEPAWAFPAGNCNHIHPSIETVVREGERAARAALKYLDANKEE